MSERSPGSPDPRAQNPDDGRPLVPGPPQSVRPAVKDRTINRSFGLALLASLIVIVALLILFGVITVTVLRRLGQLH